MNNDTQANEPAPEDSDPGVPAGGAQPAGGSQPAGDLEPAGGAQPADSVAVTAGGAEQADSAAVTATDPGDVALLGLIDRMAGLLERSDLAELEVQVGGTGLILRKPIALPTAIAASPTGTPAGTPAATGSGGSEASSASQTTQAPTRPSVKAPLTGIWYASPSPGSAAYVVEGGEVAVGQVIGLIEAMKLFNEIKSDLAGRVVKVHGEEGKLVKARQPLIEVVPL